MTNDAWRPDFGSRLVLLRAEIENTGEDHELEVLEAPVRCFVGEGTQGYTWVRIICDPDTVATDDDTAAVDFSISSSGYKVTVSPGPADSVTDDFLSGVVELLIEGHEPGDAGRYALQAWRDLLARPAGAPLSEKALVGLFGELEVLESLVKLGGDLSHWTGWKKDHCDFRLPGLVIEVKSTTSANYRRVQIHGLGQLADPEDGSRLVLVLRRLEASPAGRNVPDLIDAILALGVSRKDLLNHLADIDYSEVHRGRYEPYRFSSKEVALRQVDAEHPRLVPEMLADVDLSSIDKVDYELNLNGDADADLQENLENLISQVLAS